MDDKPKRVRETRGEHRQGRRFSNPHRKSIRRRIGHLLLWQLGFYNERAPYVEAPADFEYPNPDGGVAEGEPKAQWINHSTFLVEVEGKIILTDPVWGMRASPVDFIGPSRCFEPPVGLDELGQVDFVLISHNHYDHLDTYTVLRLKERFPNIVWYVPLGVAKWLYKLGVSRVVEMDWWERQSVPGVGYQFEFTAVPAQHYSGRGMFDYNRTLWAGWVLRVLKDDGSKRVFYFAGDSGYNDHHFKEIGEEFGGMDLSLIPIGVYHPRPFMSSVHVSPEESVKIHLDVQSELSVGTHWGTFKLSSEPFHQPPYDLYRTMEAEGLSHEKFRVLDPGQWINWGL